MWSDQVLSASYRVTSRGLVGRSAKGLVELAKPATQTSAATYRIAACTSRGRVCGRRRGSSRRKRMQTQPPLRICPVLSPAEAMYATSGHSDEPPGNIRSYLASVYTAPARAATRTQESTSTYVDLYRDVLLVEPTTSKQEHQTIYSRQGRSVLAANNGNAGGSGKQSAAAVVAQGKAQLPGCQHDVQEQCC